MEQMNVEDSTKIDIDFTEEVLPKSELSDPLIYTRQPYPLRFIQLERCPDKTPHLFTYIYKFRSPITKYWYVLRADYHEENVFAVK